MDTRVDHPDLLLVWANADPIDAAEIRRERVIRRLQPNGGNPLIEIVLQPSS